MPTIPNDIAGVDIRYAPIGYFNRVYNENFYKLTALVSPSFNCLINDNGNITQRLGNQLLGDSDTSNLVNPITNQIVWRSNTDREFLIRSSNDYLEVLYDLGATYTWITIFKGFGSRNFFRGSDWYDGLEYKDLFVMVNGSNNLYSWSGGITEILSNTVTSITKKYSSQSSNTNSIVFIERVIGVSNPSIKWSGMNYETAGFKIGDTINIIGSSLNDGQLTISSVSGDTIYLSEKDNIKAETNINGCIVGINGRETWQAERFRTSTPQANQNFTKKQVYINGISYIYTGGEATTTLTGLTALPTFITGSIITQTVQSDVPVNGDVPPSFSIQTINTWNNHLIISNTKSRQVYGSNINVNNATPAVRYPFNDFSYTTVGRYVGEGFTLTLDNVFNSVFEDSGTLYISAGRNDIYEVSFQQFQDNNTKRTLEQINILKAKTATLQGFVSPECLTKGKDGVYYFSREQSINFFGYSTGNTTFTPKPIIQTMSFDIKNLINRIDISKGIYSGYLKNNLYFFSVADQTMIIYDEIRKFWQPPQVIPINNFLVYKGKLVGGSPTKRESYTLFSTYTDNGFAIQSQVYINTEGISENFPQKATLNLSNQVWVEMLINNAITTMQAGLIFGYGGANGIVSGKIFYDMNGSENSSLYQNYLGKGIGDKSIGSVAVGGATGNQNITDIGLQKVHPIYQYNINAYYTSQFFFINQDKGGYYEIISWGLNTTQNPSLGDLQSQNQGVIDNL